MNFIKKILIAMETQQIVLLSLIVLYIVSSNYVQRFQNETRNFSRLFSDDYSNSTAWVSGIGYGSYNMSKAGTWDVKAQYFDAEKNAALSEPFRIVRVINPCSASSYSRLSVMRISVGTLA